MEKKTLTKNINSHKNSSGLSLLFIILLVFLVGGSIDLAKLTDTMDMKTKFGINYNGIRLVIFSSIGMIFILYKGTMNNLFKIYYIFLLYYSITLFYSPDYLEGIRLLAKLLVPLLVYSLANSISFKRLEKINNAFTLVILLHLLVVVFPLLKWIESRSDFVYRASGMAGARVSFGEFMFLMSILFYYRSLVMHNSHNEKTIKNHLLIIVPL